MSFVHLHVHSHYSLLDALPKVDELVRAAKKQGFKALALTDHANLYGAIEFYEACQKEGMKPIIGVEVYITPSLAEQSQYKEYHLALLALNLVGYKNLIVLVSRAHLEGFRGKPLIDKTMLRQHSAGLIGMSGCIDGEIPSLLRKENNFEKAKQAALEYRDIFGADNFFLELGDLPDLSGQMEVNTQLAELGRQLAIPLVVTRDVHYLHPDDAEAQDILTCIRDGRTLDEPNRPTSAAVDFSLATESEIVSRFRHLPEALSNTAKIAERVDLKLELNQWHFAAIEMPTGKSADEHLKDEVCRRLSVLTKITPEIQARADYELDIIAKKGYSPYFLIVSDYVGYARAHGIIETTRGSAAGSIVAYAMGITTVNPLYFKLPFERFLTLFRPSPPDVDADFADDRRDEMIAYVTKKYGADKVAQIITFGTMAARGSIRDVGRALGLSYTFCDHVSKLIPFGAQGFQMTIAKALDLEPELKTLYTTNPQVKQLIDLAQKIEGCARHTSIHAAGVVIAPTPLTDFTPVQYESGGEKIVTQYEMHAVEAAGLLKMDFLGIRNLSILGHAVEIVEKTTGKKIDIYNLDPWDDKKTYDMLARGETVGVFQMAGSGMTRYLKELKPNSIFDIMAMVALFRPGPMESIPEYIRRKNNPEMIEYLDPRMKEYLDQSLGLIVYQDDVLLTAIHLAGYNWEEADKFRKAMGKKIPEEMAKQKEKFFKGCREFGHVPEIKIHRLWELIEPFAAYGFNKAHAASYGVVAYQTAYLKANFPIQYMTAVLIAESGDIDKVPPIIHECARMGIQVLPPDINQSFKSFAMIPAAESQPAHIRFGLNGIKNLGEHIADVIYRERKENGQYRILEDFLSRVNDKDLNKKSLESLIMCGALDSLGHDRAVLLRNIETILSFVRSGQEEKDTKQHSLFSGSAIDTRTKVRLAPALPATPEEKLTWEKELLGLYVTAHPFAHFQKVLESVLTTVNDLPAQGRKQWVVVGGVIESTKKKITRAGQAMMFVTIQDVTGSLELLVFPRTYETTKDVWVEGRSVSVVGRTSEEEGDDKLFVERAYVVTKDNVAALLSQLAVNKGGSSIRQYVAPEVVEALTEGSVEITITTTELKEKAEALKTVLRQFPGEQPVYLLVDGKKKIKTSFQARESAELREAIQRALA
ncbi:MAG: DNA polymerase III subunit alpha [Candidatus Magasanikbacteria bacterium]|nr:DNA polymerase III subunit alpha [Candidatus Magasanikbacteria bacterium]